MIDAKRTRVAVAGLSLSAATLVSIALSEGWEPVAKPPVKGDVPTMGFGSTRNADGTPVRDGQTITPDRGLVLLLSDANRFERAVKRCAPVPMHSHEFSAYVSLTYNIGEGAFCGSTLAKKLNALDYAGACAEISRWTKFNGKDLPGLVKRRERERAECEGRL